MTYEKQVISVLRKTIKELETADYVDGNILFDFFKHYQILHNLIRLKKYQICLYFDKSNVDFYILENLEEDLMDQYGTNARQLIFIGHHLIDDFLKILKKEKEVLNTVGISQEKKQQIDKQIQKFKNELPFVCV